MPRDGKRGLSLFFIEVREGKMREIFLLGGCFFVLLLYFLGERIVLERSLGKIPLRICVAGTRGKSSVTRLIASSLREAGFPVLAKTTGSKPAVIFPDGSEQEIRRIGPASILEQKKILRLAASLGVEAMVVELMAIRPEFLRAESSSLLKPQYLVITNVRLDHTGEMGRTKEEISVALAQAIPRRSTVFTPREEFYPFFFSAAEKKKAKVVQVFPELSQEKWPLMRSLMEKEFLENINLSLALGKHLGIKREVALKGMEKAQPDFGSLKIWETSTGIPPQTWILVSAFAANEPESTRKIIVRLKDKLSLEKKRIIGLLNFREDRGERTLQWLRSLREGGFSEFDRIVFIGAHFRALQRYINKNFAFSSKPRYEALAAKSAERIMKELLTGERGEGIVVGMGNMGGLGKELVIYWEKIGHACGF